MNHVGFIALATTTVNLNGVDMDVPDLDASENDYFVAEGDRFHLRKESAYTVFQPLGVNAGKTVYFIICEMPSRVTEILAYHPADSYTMSEALADGTFRAWLVANTNLMAVKRISDGQVVGIHPPVVLAGQSALHLCVSHMEDADDLVTDVLT